MHDLEKAKKDVIKELQILRQETRELQNSNDLSTAELELTKESLKETHNQNQRLQEALDNVESCVYMKDLQSRYIYANSETLKLFHCSSEDIIGRGDEDFFPHETVKKLKSVDLRVFAGEQTKEEIDTTNHHNDRKVYLEYKAPLYSNSEQGKVCGLLGISTDITERKRNEEELEKNYNLLRIAGIKANLGGWIVDLMESRVYWSDEVAAIHEMPVGFSPQKEDAINFYAPECRDRVMEVFTICARKGMSFDEEMQIITANGKRLWVRTIGDAVRDTTGKIVKIQGAFQDISERKWTENQLKERIKELNAFFRMSEFIEKEDVTLEDYYQKFVSIIPDSMQSPDMTYARIEINNQEFCTENYKDTPWKFSVPIMVNNREAGRFEVGYLENFFDDGEKPHKNEERKLISAFAERLGHLTERKLLEESFYCSVEESPLGIRIVTSDGKTVYVNKALLKIYEYNSREEFFKSDAKKRYTPESYKQHQKRKRKRKGGEETDSYEVSIVRNNGEICHLKILRKEILWNGKNHFQVIYQEITERKRAMLALQESEELLAQTQEIAKIGSWKMDLDSNRLTWSDETFRIFGHDPRELPVTYDAFLKSIHPDDRKSVNAAYVKSMKEGKDTYTTQHRIIQKNTGLIRHLYGKGAHHRNNEGKVIRTVGMVQDITERVEKEELIRQSLLEKETLLSEIHHRVKNNMAVIYSLVDLQQEYGTLKKDPDSILMETKSRIRSMALVHEIVYENESFTDLDFLKLMEKLIENIENIFKNENQDIKIKLDVKDVYLNLNMSVPLSLLANELISNAFKHAFPDRESGEIAISFYKKKEGYQFVVKDTGCSVTDVTKISKSNSLGMTIIGNLVKQLRGEINMKLENGLSIEVWIPESYK